MHTRRSWGRVILLASILLYFVIGPMRVMEFLYAAGLYPRATNEEVIAALRQRQSTIHDSVTCEKDVAGWEYVCDYAWVSGHGDPEIRRRRVGIMTSWLTPIYRIEPLPIDGPILSDAENRKQVTEHNSRFRGPVNLRTASIPDLMRVMFVDKELAVQIHAAVKSGEVTSIDGLLKIKGIDPPKLDIMRKQLVWQ